MAIGAPGPTIDPICRALGIEDADTTRGKRRAAPHSRGGAGHRRAYDRPSRRSELPARKRGLGALRIIFDTVYGLPA
jgi:hypothetical protein